MYIPREAASRLTGWMTHTFVGLRKGIATDKPTISNVSASILTEFWERAFAPALDISDFFCSDCPMFVVLP